MQRLPQHREPGGGDVAVHLALALASILSLWNFFATLGRLDARRGFIAEALFRAEPAAAVEIVEAHTQTTPQPVLEPPSPARPTAVPLDKVSPPQTKPLGAAEAGRAAI